MSTQPDINRVIERLDTLTSLLTLAYRNHADSMRTVVDCVATTVAEVRADVARIVQPGDLAPPQNACRCGNVLPDLTANSGAWCPNGSGGQTFLCLMCVQGERWPTT